MTSVPALLQTLNSAGVTLSVQDGKLRAQAEPGVIDATMRQAIAAHRSALVALLSGTAPSAGVGITRRGTAGPAPAAFAQQGLWLIEQMGNGGATYNIPLALRVTGEGLQPGRLRQAIVALMRRHESLRTVFRMQDEALLQCVREDMAPQVEVSDVSTQQPAEQDGRVAAMIAGEATAPFDLANGPLLRVHLVQQSEQQVLLLTMHHIISDGWSLGILVDELVQLYRSGSENDASLPPLPVQYGDYAAWQRASLSGARLDELLRYWKGQLQGAPVVIELPPARGPRRAGAASCPITLPSRTASALAMLARDEGATLFMALVAVFGLLLQRYSDQDDLSIGTPVAGRSRPELEGLIGMFVNTVVLRMQIARGEPFTGLLARVRETALQAFAHQDLPFERLVTEMKPERSATHAPLCQTMFVFQNAPRGRLEIPGLHFEAIDIPAPAAKFNLTCSLAQTEDGAILGTLQYDTALFDAAVMQRMAAHFALLAERVCAAAQRPVRELSLWHDETAQQHCTGYPDGGLPHRHFERWAAAAPERTALVHENDTVSYGELNRQANRIAHALLALGVRPDDRVALCAERGIALVAGLLGILKAGAAYVPIDPLSPDERIRWMLDDSQPLAVLVQQAQQARCARPGLATLLLDGSELTEQPVHDPDPQVLGLRSHHLAYVIYTSGSTGQPKGVMVEHANVMRLFQSSEKLFGFGPDDTWTLFHSFAFDFSVWEIWGALLHGGRLVIVPGWCSRSPADFFALLCRERVTVLNQTPSAFRQLIEAQRHSQERHALRYVVFGGEALDLHILGPWFERNDAQQTQLVNMYGITETTVHVTWRVIVPADLQAGVGSVIGVPLPDLRIRLLDRDMQPVPDGVRGELYVGGAGVARGYLNREQLTAERFLADPWLPGERLYRTGDLGRRLEDGSLEYLGRNDQQVKIRGFRIELGEIEARLAACDGVRDAVVLVREDRPGDQRLVAYVTGHGAQAPDVDSLRNALAESLPAYMVPAAIVRMAAFPLTLNGKLDRRALPAPDDAAHAHQAYEAPAEGLEAVLAALWQDLLGVERIGRHDRFFDLGGDSLLAVQMVARLLAQTGCEVPVRALFVGPTLAEFAAAAQAARELGAGTGQTLVPLRPHGSRLPLFLVHAGRGEIGYGRALLPGISDEVPVYALAASGFLQDEQPSHCVIEMAARYVSAIRSRQPFGPYRIAGWSAGGTIAIEMGRQLHAVGERVSFIGLIDTMAEYPDAAVPMAAEHVSAASPEHAPALLAWLSSLLAQHWTPALRELYRDGNLDGMLAECQRTGLVPAGVGQPMLRRYLAVWHGIDLAVRSYRLSPPAFPIHLFIAGDEARADPLMGWQRLEYPALRVRRLRGGHYSIVTTPYVDDLSAELASALLRSEEDDAESNKKIMLAQTYS